VYSIYHYVPVICDRSMIFSDFLTATIKRKYIESGVKYHNFIPITAFHVSRNVWRYRRGNKNPLIKEDGKYNGQKEKYNYTNFTKNLGWTQVIWYDKQIMLCQWQPSYYYCNKPGDDSCIWLIIECEWKKTLKIWRH